VRRRLPVRPMARSDAETADPMNAETALRAVEDEILELALEVGLHPQEFEPEHLRVDGDRVIASTGSLRFIDELVSPSPPAQRWCGRRARGSRALGVPYPGRPEPLADLLESQWENPSGGGRLFDAGRGHVRWWYAYSS
jgi:hypothetical protein